MSQEKVSNFEKAKKGIQKFFNKYSDPKNLKEGDEKYLIKSEENKFSARNERLNSELLKLNNEEKSLLIFKNTIQEIDEELQKEKNPEKIDSLLDRRNSVLLDIAGGDRIYSGGARGENFEWIESPKFDKTATLKKAEEKLKHIDSRLEEIKTERNKLKEKVESHVEKRKVEQQPEPIEDFNEGW